MENTVKMIRCSAISGKNRLRQQLLQTAHNREIKNHNVFTDCFCKINYKSYATVVAVTAADCYRGSELMRQSTSHSK